MYKAIIFDFDGVLADTTAGYAKVYRKVLHANGMKTNDEEVKSQFGKSVIDIFISCTAKANRLKDAPKLTSEFYHEVSGKRFRNSMALFPGAEGVLKKLKRQGFLLGLASGTNSHMLAQFLDFLGIRKYFNSILGSEDVKKCKPDPEIILKSVASLGVKRDDAVYVGDAKADISAARTAGVACALVTTGVLCEKEAEKLRPDYILKDLGEIWKILNDKPAKSSP